MSEYKDEGWIIHSEMIVAFVFLERANQKHGTEGNENKNRWKDLYWSWNPDSPFGEEIWKAIWFEKED